MKYYIASGLGNFKQVQELKAVLDARGWEHTYDWTKHGPVWHEGLASLSAVAAAEAEGVLAAEVVIALLPGGRGTHTEVGMAIGQVQLGLMIVEAGLAESLDRRIVIYSPTPEKDFAVGPGTCAFYHHPLVERFSSWDEMVSTFLTECGA